jgi:acyl carrier protein
MSDQKIISSITPKFREIFEIPELVVTRELDANQVESWDSLNHITLIVELEELTGCSFSTNELAELRNAGDFIDLLKVKGYNG